MRYQELERHKWRGCKSLGSLLCSTKDVDRRIVLAEAAFRRLCSLWVRPQHVSIQRRLCLYEALVVSVVMYNASCWAVPASQLKPRVGNPAEEAPAGDPKDPMATQDLKCSIARALHMWALVG